MKNKGGNDNKYEDIKDAIKNIDKTNFEEFEKSFMDNIKPGLIYSVDRKYNFSNNFFLIQQLIKKFGMVSPNYFKEFVTKSIQRAAKENKLQDGSKAEPLISKELFDNLKELNYLPNDAEIERTKTPSTIPDKLSDPPLMTNMFENRNDITRPKPIGKKIGSFDDLLVLDTQLKSENSIPSFSSLDPSNINDIESSNNKLSSRDSSVGLNISETSTPSSYLSSRASTPFVSKPGGKKTRKKNKKNTKTKKKSRKVKK